MKVQNKSGAVAVYALLSITVFTAIVFSVFVIVNLRHKSQLKTAEEIKREAEQYIIDNTIEIVEDPKEIYIYNSEHTNLIGSDVYVYIPEEKKIYKFTEDAIYIEEHFGS